MKTKLALIRRAVLLLVLSTLNLALSTVLAQTTPFTYHGSLTQGGLPVTGGNCSLTGGFWSLYAVQAPGAPLRSITITTTNTAVVSWPTPWSGFNLQVNTNSAASVNWSNAPGTIQDNGTIKYLIVNPPAENRFYRLKNP